MWNVNKGMKQVMSKNQCVIEEPTAVATSCLLDRTLDRTDGNKYYLDATCRASARAINGRRLTTKDLVFRPPKPKTRQRWQLFILTSARHPNCKLSQR